jgi:hypothetical protein
MKPDLTWLKKNKCKDNLEGSHPNAHIYRKWKQRDPSEAFRTTK